MRLLNDICRCAGKKCKDRKSCLRYLKFLTGGPRTPRATNLSEGTSPCRYMINEAHDE